MVYSAADDRDVRFVRLYFGSVLKRTAEHSGKTIKGTFDIRHYCGAFNYRVEVEDASGKKSSVVKYHAVARTCN